MERTTEADSRYDQLEHMSTADLLGNINREDQTVAQSVQLQLSRIETLVDAVVEQMK